jgi:thioredoxin 1
VGAIIGFLIASSLSTGRHIEPPAAAAPEESHVLQLAAEADFDGVLKDNKVVLVDFYADWCGPCRMMKPVIGEVAAQYADRAKVVAVNVDAFRSLAGRYGVRSIPDIRVFKEGKAARTFVGVTGKDALVAAIEEALK